MDSIERTAVASAPADGQPRNGVSQPVEGLSQFLGRILDQLSLTAWLPAAMLVCNLAVLIELRGNATYDLGTAVTALTTRPLGILVVLIFALILAAMITQSLEFAAIRLLEGYWGSSRLADRLASWRIRRHVRQRHRLLARADTAERDAFDAARNQLLALPGANPIVIAALEAHVRGQATDAFSRQTMQRAVQIDWRDDAPAHLLRQVGALDLRLSTYPVDSRVLPTRLGNVLRSTEDQLRTVQDADLRGFVLRKLHRIPGPLLHEHDQYRNRLDMYCMLVVVCALLAAVAPALLIDTRDHILAGGLAIFGYATLGVIGYRAAIATGRDYATTLAAIDNSETRAS